MTNADILLALMWSLVGGTLATAIWMSQHHKIFMDGWNARKEWEKIEKKHYENLGSEKAEDWF